jgi:hypothetical protein
MRRVDGCARCSGRIVILRGRVDIGHHERLEDGADSTEDFKGGLMEDSRTEVVVECIAQGFEV